MRYEKTDPEWNAEAAAWFGFITMILALIIFGFAIVSAASDDDQTFRQIRIEQKLDCLLHRTPHFCFVPAPTHARKHV